MRRLTFLLYLFFAFLKSSATDKDDILALVQQWNELHNTKAVSGFKNMYTPEVLFYGRLTSNKSIYKKKAAFLRTSFSQQIISTVELNWYASGVVKCSFTKQTQSKKGPKQHAAYLLVKNIDGRYLITGESDVETDLKLGVNPALGKEIDAPGTEAARNKKSGLLVLVAVAALGVAAFLLLRKQKRARGKTTHSKPAWNDNEPDYVELPHTPTNRSSTTTSPEKAKGDAFERYVIERFKPEYFTLLEWRGDKYHQGIYAASTKLPDMEYEYRSRYEQVRFAVECKWRAGFAGGPLKWATDSQLATYKQFEQERRMAVFVLLGIGGQPQAPAKVYIIPLNQLHSCYLYEAELPKYQRYKTGSFFLYADQMILE